MCYYCDNQEVLNKCVDIKKHKQYYDKLYRTTDHDAVLFLKDLIFLKNANVSYKTTHQSIKEGILTNSPWQNWLSKLTYQLQNTNPYEYIKYTDSNVYQ